MSNQSQDPSVRLSVGLAVYNGEEYLHEAMDSLLAQTYRDFELIICDNASSDRTEQICREYEGRDSRVRYHRNDQNYGAAWNVNRVFELSVGEYFRWAAHDDICAPTLVERCVEVLDSTPSAVLCYTDAVIIDENGQRVRDYVDLCETRSSHAHKRFEVVLRNFGLSNPLYGVIRADALRETRLLGGYLGADGVLLAELALKGEIVKIPDQLFYRRDHPKKAARPSASNKDAIASWSGVEKQAGVGYFNSRLLKGYAACLWHTPLPFWTRLRAYMCLGRWLRWKRNEIAAEFGHYLRQLLRFR